MINDKKNEHQSNFSMLGETDHKIIRIGYLLDKNPLNKKLWSGTHYSLFNSLQQYYDVIYLGPLPLHIKGLRYILRKTSSIMKQLFNKTYLYDSNLYLSKMRGKFWKKKVASHQLDLIFTATAHSDIAFIETDTPIVFLADATYSLMKDYYPQFSNPFYTSDIEVKTIETLALKNSNLIIYPSEWAAQSAIKEYGAAEKNVVIIPFGANIDSIPERDNVIQKDVMRCCTLLFVGKDWNRKGGAIAYETLIELEKMNIEAELIVCGCEPPKKISHKKLKVVKWATEQQLTNFYMNSHFFILPTRAECFGIVFSEANAYGLPIITTDTGGIPGVIKQGKNGYMLPLDADGQEYAKLIFQLWQNKELYIKLRRNSRKEFDERLNWNAWGSTVNVAITKMLNRHRQTPENNEICENLQA